MLETRVFPLCYKVTPKLNTQQKRKWKWWRWWWRLHIFLKKKWINKKTEKNREEIWIPEFGGWGRNKGFWPEYLPMCEMHFCTFPMIDLNIYAKTAVFSLHLQKFRIWLCQLIASLIWQYYSYSLNIVFLIFQNIRITINLA